MTLPHINPLKLATSAGKPILAELRHQLSLRDADLKPVRLGGVDAEIAAALGVLAGDATAGAAALAQYVRGKLSGRPEVFDEDPVPQWLATDKVRELVRAAAYAQIDGEDVQPFADQAAEFFAGFNGADGPGRGYAAFEYALPYVLLAVARKLDVGDRLTLRSLGHAHEKLDALAKPLPVPLLDEEVDRQTDRLRRARFFEGPDHAAAARDLAARVEGGDLSAASPQVRAAALAACATWLARAERRIEAERLLATSRALADTAGVQIVRAALLALDDRNAALASLAPVDSEAKRGAALSAIARTAEPGGIADWAEAAGIDRSQLDSDGRMVILMDLLRCGQWEDAAADAAALDAAAIARTPALGQVAGIARAVATAARDLRAAMASGPPIDPARFPLADTAGALAERRAAAGLIRDAGRAATDLGASEAGASCEAFSLWLELRDPALTAGAAKRLGELVEGDDPVRWIPLALAFGVATDLERVECAVARAAALLPGGSAAIALARLALALRQPTPGKSADYIGQHRRAFAGHVDAAELNALEIGLLAAAGRSAEAGERLETAAESLGEHRAERLRQEIAAGPAGLTLGQLKTAYASAPSTANLAQLVDALEAQGHSARFSELARRLVAATGSAATAERVARALTAAGDWDGVAEMLGCIPDLVDGSRELAAVRAWDAYRRGDLGLAERTLNRLRVDGDDRSLRGLERNILLASGRWPDLARIVEEEWGKRDQRLPEELLDLAQIAGQVGSRRVGDLIALAASKAPADPVVLANSYMIATQAGLDDRMEIHGWLETAAALSNDDGPIQRANLADLIAGQPDWNRRVADIQARLRAGELPLHVAAAALRRPSLEWRLGAMVANVRERDPRWRRPVPAFSGVRGTVEPFAGRLALGGSALVSLGLLGLVDAVVSRGEVLIPHATLGWLFQERQKLAFHQPSRIAFAHRLQLELGAGRMRRFMPEATVDGRLADAIGASLAAMIATAEARPDGAPQRLVVRSAPIERIGSLGGQAVDMEAHAGVLRSCQSVIDALVVRGRLLTAAEGKARTYLTASEQRWPAEAAIPDGSDLYLDDLSVALLDAAGVLNQVHAAGFRVHVPEGVTEETAAFLELEAQSADIERVIEHIRASLATGIANGAVSLGAIGDEGGEVGQHPDMGVVRLAGRADAVVSDDRYINRTRALDVEDSATPVWSSLDVLALLHAEGRITNGELEAHRATLRDAGLVLFPTDGDELAALVSRASLRDGAMVETGELRAIRENLQLAIMRRFLSLPAEMDFPQSLCRAAAAAILRQWTAAIPDDAARARSRWLLARADVRDWAAAANGDEGTGIAAHGLAIPVSTLLTHRPEVLADARDRYDAWLDEEVLQPLRHQEPTVHAWLMERFREVILAMTRRLREGDDDGL